MSRILCSRAVYKIVSLAEGCQLPLLTDTVCGGLIHACSGLRRSTVSTLVHVPEGPVRVTISAAIWEFPKIRGRYYRSQMKGPLICRISNVCQVVLGLTPYPLTLNPELYTPSEPREV